MIKKISIQVFVIFGIVFFHSCREKYEPVIINTNPNYLVVDGMLVGGQDSTKLFLSRTRKLDEGAINNIETGATVSVEDANGSMLYVLQELPASPGTYAIDAMNLAVNNSYKLHIITADGKNYISDNMILKDNPPIDSVTWNKPVKDVNIYVNTHDSQGSSKYYRWDYEETWEYISPYISEFMYDKPTDNVLPRDPNDSINHCWRTQYSTDIIIASTEKFSQDVIVNQLVRNIPYGSFELGNKYSILVKQHVLNKEGFDYLQILKKITEQSGSLFSAQPSQLTGNIHSTSDPDEIVIGYVTASLLSKTRIYIKREEVEPWGYTLACSSRLIPNNPDSIKYYFSGDNYPQYIPLYFVNGITPGYISADPGCTDCRTLGGATKKPDFWQ